MAFNTRKFVEEKWEPRTEAVAVPDLKPYFDDEEKPEFIVRGLTGIELGKCNEAAEQARNLMKVIDGISSRIPEALTDGIKEIIGDSKSTPADVARRLQLVQLGCVNPTVDFLLAGKLCKAHPVEFWQLSSAIERLTAAGHIPGKAHASGETTM